MAIGIAKQGGHSQRSIGMPSDLQLHVYFDRDVNWGGGPPGSVFAVCLIHFTDTPESLRFLYLMIIILRFQVI